MWRKSGTKLQGRYPATPSGGFMLGLDEFVYLAKSNLNLTIWLVQMHSKLASLVRNNIWTCQIVKFALDFAKNTNPSRPSINPPVGVAGSVLIYITWGCLDLFYYHHYLAAPTFFQKENKHSNDEDAWYSNVYGIDDDFVFHTFFLAILVELNKLLF